MGVLAPSRWCRLPVGGRKGDRAMATEPLQAMSEMLDHELADLAGRVDRDALACLFGQETGQEAAVDLLGQFTELYPEAAGRADTDDRDSLVGLLNLLEALDDGDRIDWFARLATRDHPDESDAAERVRRPDGQSHGDAEIPEAAGGEHAGHRVERLGADVVEMVHRRGNRAHDRRIGDR